MILKNRIFLAKKMVLFILILHLGIPFFAQDPQEPLKYKVLVNVMTVPLFIVDTNGNPVFDLKEEEFQLKVNDEPVKILQFRRYEFGFERKIKEGAETQVSALAAQTAQNRVIFVILDSMFNSLTGFRRSKEITINLIKEALPGDNFVILENNPVGGIKYIGGFESDAEVLIKKIKKLKPPPEKWSKDLHSRRVMFNNVEYNPLTDPRQGLREFESFRKTIVNSERLRYKHQVKYFSQVLSQFKYALKTIDKPKIVFLMSEGVALGAFRASLGPGDNQGLTRLDTSPAVELSPSEEAAVESQLKKGFYSILNKDEDTVFDQNKIYSAFMLKYLLDVVKSINKGGSVLYTINPRRTDDINDDEASGEMSLRYLASESGGKYFAGAKPKKIIERIKKTTAAYYELFFTVTPDMGKDMNIRIDCRREGVRVHSLIHSERNRPYLKMEPVQKKIFALNVVTGGSWSRMVGKVMKVKYKKGKTGKKGDEKTLSIHVPLPKVMQGHKIDMFSIRVDPKTQKTAIDYISCEVKDTVKLNIKRRKGKNQFFAIIEPTTPYCIYNKI